MRPVCGGVCSAGVAGDVDVVLGELGYPVTLEALDGFAVLVGFAGFAGLAAGGFIVFAVIDDPLAALGLVPPAACWNSRRCRRTSCSFTRIAGSTCVFVI